MDTITNEGTTSGQKKNPPSLSTLRNPTFEFLHSNYNKSELQKFGSKLKLKGIWATKEKVVEKLVLYFSTLNRPSSPQQRLTTEESQDKENEGALSDIIERFEIFMRETNDNFYVLNNIIAEKERDINELKTKLFLAEETIKSLQEERGKKGQALDDVEDSAEKKILLIGDSNLQEIRNDDLQGNVVVRTLPDANMAMLRSWIEEKLTHPLKECVIYCGTQDILEKETTPDETIDELVTLVADLKRSYDGIIIKICELVPSLKSVELNVKINQFNAKIEEWCKAKEVVFLKTNNYFRLGTGEIDTLCYENIEELDFDVLSRVGATRLLDAISSVSEFSFVCSNWRVAKQKSFGRSNLRKINRNNSRVGGIRAGSYLINRRQSTYQNVNYYSNQEYKWGNRNGNGNGRLENNWNEPRNYQINLRSHNNRGYMSTNRNKPGCYNCGEFNHVQSNCRYDHKIKCNVCHEYGHKSKLCSNRH